MSDAVLVSLSINDEVRPVAIPIDRTLLDVLREDLRLTGAKRACEAGACGACNVLIDGHTARSCLTLAADLEGCAVRTIEGLAQDGVPSVVQQAFLDAGAIQCGFCMPGMIMSATELLADNPSPTIAEIRTGISGNLCRCSGYVKVIEAIALAARRLAPSRPMAAAS
ncbi:(2Fe-2S)-binding protein [Ancylobacter sonchi]|uniref:(2Fe-2S)-binding protein n=1 Tax=Ancylobacter sonchi TaxID=1937790 RepID=UPI001BD47BDA|nr:(2Fe-2S)-binding protein [Ancylobacter sonchi]MBS7533216.1 (2Fe-2S)-binding protein [Ancylobacter sonchi]